MRSKEIYKERILELYKNPENFGHLTKYNKKATEFNTFCGDKITIELLIINNKVEQVAFSGKGCAISTASASLLTEAIKGKTINQLNTIKPDNLISLLNIPIGPLRMKCALLPLIALRKALKNDKF